MNIGERIRQIREEAGEQQNQTADAIGCSAQILSNVERNCNNPTIDLLCRLADHFQTSTDYLLGRSNERWHTDFTAAMTEDESDLLAGFRKMDKKKKRILLGTMEELNMK